MKQLVGLRSRAFARLRLWRGASISWRATTSGLRHLLAPGSWLGLAVLVLVARAEAQRELSWDLRIPERVELVAGTSSTLAIAIAVDRGLTISKDAALIIDLAPEGGVAVKRRRLGRSDAVDPDAESPRFAIPLRAEAAGDYAVRVKIRFWLCGTKVCRPIEAKRSVTIAVTAPAPPPPPPVDAGVDAALVPDARKRR